MVVVCALRGCLVRVQRDAERERVPTKRTNADDAIVLFDSAARAGLTGGKRACLIDGLIDADSRKWERQRVSWQIP